MNFLKYILLFFLSTFLTIYLSFFLGHIIGEGSNQLSIVIAAVAIMNGTLITILKVIIEENKKR